MISWFSPIFIQYLMVFAHESKDRLAIWTQSGEQQLLSRYIMSISASAEIKCQRPNAAKMERNRISKFSLYVGIVLLKGNLKEYIYNHFLVYFCAITIFSSNLYVKKLVSVGKKCIEIFIERYNIFRVMCTI